MNFDKAYKELLDGKKIRRKEWEPFMHLKLINGSVQTFTGEYTHFDEDSNILISTGWKVLHGDGKELSFLEALEELRNKKCLTRKDWEENNLDKFIFIDQGQIAVCAAVPYKFMPGYKCLCSMDWEIIR